jgi:hypothetical protein
VIVDGEDHWLEAAETSAVATRGRRLEILAIWLIVGAGFTLLGWLSHTFMEIGAATGAPPIVPEMVSLATRVVADTFGLALAAAVYHELGRTDP